MDTVQISKQNQDGIIVTLLQATYVVYLFIGN